VLAAGSLLVALGLAIVGLAPNLPLYLGGWLVVGTGMGAALYDAAFATLGALYGAAARGPIAGVTLFGGFASTVCWPFSALLVESFGWRGACLVYAAIHILLGMGAALLVVPARAPRTPESIAAQPAAAGLQPDERVVFVLLSGALTIGAAILSLVGTQLITLLRGSGLSLGEAVGLGMIIGPAAVGARAIETLAGSRYHPIWTMAASVTLVCGGALLFFVGPAAFAAAIAVYAAGNGIGSIAKGTLPLALFGAARYPALAGRLALPVMLAMALAPYVGAWSFERGGVAATLALFVGLAAANVLLVAMLVWLTRARRQAA
jgi:MFS family permease